jgi:hypothetical protein
MELATIIDRRMAGRVDRKGQPYKANVSAVGKHLKWPEAKVQAAINYAKAFPEEIEGALSENAATDFEALKRMLPQAVELASGGAAKG